ARAAHGLRSRFGRPGRVSPASHAPGACGIPNVFASPAEWPPAATVQSQKRAVRATGRALRNRAGNVTFGAREACACAPAGRTGHSKETHREQGTADT